MTPPQLQWEVSGATVAGEGEVKILGRLLRPAPCVAPGDTHGERWGGGGADGRGAVVCVCMFWRCGGGGGKDVRGVQRSTGRGM
jgi:hypothetical protein